MPPKRESEPIDLGHYKDRKHGENVEGGIAPDMKELQRQLDEFGITSEEDHPEIKVEHGVPFWKRGS